MDFERIGLRMKDRREELGLSLAEIGARVGTSASAVQRWERGDTPSLKTTKLKAIAEALDTTVEYLLDVQPSFVPVEGIRPADDPQKGDLTFTIKDEAMMNARLLPGDTAYIISTKQFEDGQILAVRHNGEVIIRRAYRKGGIFELWPENPLFALLRTENLDIIGRVVAFYGQVK